jgi:two-component system, NtrC family, response regulator GlrR
MEDQNLILFDLNPGNPCADLLLEILTPCRDEGVALHHVRVDFAEIFLNGDGSPLVNERGFVPALILLALSRQHLPEVKRLAAMLKSRWPVTPLIAVAEAVEPFEIFGLYECGIADFITPPLKAIDILPRVWRLLRHTNTSQTLAYALKERFGMRQIIGSGKAFLSAVQKVPLIAKCNASVLITGETGTGKELFARAIHYLSPRASSPFIPVNCGAIPFELIENELFGHAQGAFTGAARMETGLIQAADTGTLFLDEVDSMPPLAQVKLLRFLQEKEYRPLGSSKTQRADVRIIAATNNDCEEAIREGKLRQDLFYRLNVIPLRLPPLRERRDDIPLLASYFLDKYAAQFGRFGLAFDDDALLALTMYDWPGNVRELENVIERAVALSEHGLITLQQLSLPDSADISGQRSFREAKADFVAQFERNYIQKLLLAYRCNITKAAQAARKNRRAFWHLIRKHQIDVQSLKL